MVCLADEEEGGDAARIALLGLRPAQQHGHYAALALGVVHRQGHGAVGATRGGEAADDVGEIDLCAVPGKEAIGPPGALVVAAEDRARRAVGLERAAGAVDQDGVGEVLARHPDARQRDGIVGRREHGARLDPRLDPRLDRVVDDRRGRQLAAMHDAMRHRLETLARLEPQLSENHRERVGVGLRHGGPAPSGQRPANRDLAGLPNGLPGRE